MPLFEYACERCATTFEELVPASRATKAVGCPRCGSTETRKRVSTFASHVKTPAATPSACPTGSCCLGGNCGL
jgi:putative FmdB family regulatory protein